MGTFLSDLRHGMRLLLRNPGSSAVILIVLGIAIGANSAIYTVAHTTILHRLPFQDPDGLVAVWETDPTSAEPRQLMPPEDFETIEHESHAFKRMAAIVTGKDIAFDMVSHTEPERLPGALVSSDFFSLLGVKPILGRTFMPEENNAGSDQVVVLSAGLFKGQFSGDKSILGKAIALNGRSYTIVGIMPPGFAYPDGAQIWLPNPLQADMAMNLGFHFYPYFRVIARLSSGTTLRQAQTEMDVIAHQLSHRSITRGSGPSVAVVSLHKDLYGDFGPAVLVLLSAVGLVLLIACANVGNLLLARATARQREVAVRMALGASRSRLVRQLFTECALTALLGGALGLLLSRVTLSWLTGIVPSNVFVAQGVKTDGSILVFTFLTAVSAAILFGLAPALFVSQLHLTPNLQGLGSCFVRATTGRARRGIAIVEIALALVLLVAAILTIRTYWGLTKTDLGLNPQNVLTLKITLPGWKYQSPLAQAAFFDETIRQLKEVPGMAYIGLTTSLPLEGESMETPFMVNGATIQKHGSQEFANFAAVSPDFFKALGVPLISGRFFDEDDDNKAPEVAIVDDFAASHLWPDQNAVGKQIAVEGSPEKPVWRTVIGVVRRVRQSLRKTSSEIAIYVPYSQSSIPLSSMTVVSRKSEDTLNLVSGIRSAIWKVDRDQPITDVETMKQLISTLMSHERFATMLLGIFGGIAFFLAAIGVYGVMSFSVVQRCHEFGVRLAIGALPGDVVRLVIHEGIVTSLWGVGLGLVCYGVVARLLSSMLYGVKAIDPLVLGVAVAMLIVVGTLASYLPARRVTRLDPAMTLRHE
jgi:putative ABC transport system permease protein